MDYVGFSLLVCRMYINLIACEQESIIHMAYFSHLETRAL